MTPACRCVLPLVAVLTFVGANAASAQGFALELNNGRVTLDAQNAPVAQILAHWAKVGGITLVNGEALPSTPVTLKFVNARERDVLAVLLRNVGGYILGGSATSIDRIMIMTPDETAPRATASSGTRAPQPPANAPGATAAASDPFAGSPEWISDTQRAAIEADREQARREGLERYNQNIEMAAGQGIRLRSPGAEANRSAEPPVDGRPGVVSGAGAGPAGSSRPGDITRRP